MDASKRSILLTNDDGIGSPGLWAAAEALSALGFVTVVAPREQQSGSGRSMPLGSDGAIGEQTVEVGGKSWTVYSVGGSPAQAVQHAIFEIMPHPPQLVVAGINYGENVTTSVTISGTVGAALEAAAEGIPALAVSQETESRYHLTHTTDIDFGPAAYFTARFAERLLAAGTERNFTDGERVLSQGEPGEEAFVILGGFARVVRDGREIVRFGPGEFFGEVAMLDGRPRTADVFAEGSLRCIALPREVVKEAIAAQPDLAWALLEVVAGRIRGG